MKTTKKKSSEKKTQTKQKKNHFNKLIGLTI